MRKTTFFSALLALFGGVSMSAQTSIQNIAIAPVTTAAEFVDGGQYVIALKDNGYIYTASHTCAAAGIDANEGYRLKRNGAQPTVGSTDMSKVFTLVVKGDGTYAIKDYQGNYIDNIDHGATTPADPVHTTADECTFTFTANGSPYWRINSTSTATKRSTLDGGGADTDGVVLTGSAANGNFAFYRVNFNEAEVAVDRILAVSAKEVTDLSQIKNGKQYIIKNFTNGFIYETAHTCAASPESARDDNNKIARGASTVAAGSADMSYVFTLYVNSDDTYSFKGQTGYIGNTNPGVSTPGAQLHITNDENQKSFNISAKTYSEDEGVQYFGIVSTNSGKNTWDYGAGADGGGIVMTADPATNSSKFAFYEVITSTSDVTFNPATNISALESNGLGLATFCVAIDTKMPEGVTAYVVENTPAATATLTPLAAAGEVVPANVPVILTGAKGSTTQIPAAVSGSVPTVESNLLVGTPTGPVDLSAITGATPFILGANGEGNVAFYAVSSSDAVLAIGKAYLSVPTGSGEGTIRLSFGDNLTGIDNVATAVENAKVVDLSGRRVNKTTKGSLYISGGKVFIAQ